MKSSSCRRVALVKLNCWPECLDRSVDDILMHQRRKLVICWIVDAGG